MSSSPGPANQPADGAILGTAVRTLDDERPSASALAWRDGEIVAVGDDADVRPQPADGHTPRERAGAPKPRLRWR